jgi:hypothetical protein
MEEKFAAAAMRHYEDAETLAASERLDGAGHLIGFSAECAIKHAVLSLRSDKESLHGHFPELVNVAKRHLNQRLHHGLYTVIKAPTFMQGWTVHGRYSDDGSVTRQNYDLWRAQARALMYAAKLKGK